MIRFGLCCKFETESIKFRTTTAFQLKRLQTSIGDYTTFLSDLILENAHSLEEAIFKCMEMGIGDFRINSQFFPIYTHPEFGYHLSDLPNFQEIEAQLERCHQITKEHDFRLTFHPDQFVVLSSPSKEVVTKSIEEIEYQNYIAELVGADVINIHGGGGYGDKKSALMRFSKVFSHLSDGAKKRLTLENDDRIYTPEDLLPLCHQLNIPLVYDVHHHRCNPDGLSMEEATSEALETWDREPLFHLSSPRGGWGEKGENKHHDYIDPADFPSIWLKIDPLTIEIEAKAKEVAIGKLIGDLCSGAT